MSSRDSSLDRPAWPPVAEDAQALAMALAEALEVNTVETFLSFITASPTMRRQLLDLAGASDRWQEITYACQRR